ncbi:ATP-binding protein [Conexibacter stalactiti]|uniref:ATP-binding protein n=1 Tax=Conexibacter stalactiti TaxID=1940611 RepID=A0ABU4HZ33_9ACTN|nr:ATP-binding protein [Conexibacter stalactiti]MDW5597319.1 ATP-binding protein [Conexibacter stalactiti]MEC5037961.1 ATP-binding protein [Conexibacter stalactiti]
MANSEMLQELIRAHVAGDSERFRTIAMQVAAREARSGHRLVAGRIRDLLDAATPSSGPVSRPTPLATPPKDLRDVLDVRYPEEGLDRVVLAEGTRRVVDRILAEQRAASDLGAWGLQPRRRLLFHGPPGCGKTMTAAVIAHELALPLLRIRTEVLFSRFMGETSAVLDAVFVQASKQRGVYLFDEFDAVGKQRADSNDVGEARRILSAFLQLLDADESTSVLIAATNEPSFLDTALMRRFDDVAYFGPPDAPAIRRLLQLLTSSYRLPARSLDRLAREAVGLTFADVTRAVTDAAKAMVLSRRRTLRHGDLAAAITDLRERQPIAP